MKYVLFSGSLRTESLNKKLISVAHKIISTDSKNQTMVVDIRDLLIPVYDGDIEAVGIPEGVKKLGQLIADAQAIIIASPEYNGSIAGPLKNTIDWVSRLRPVPFEAKPVLLLGASPGGFGSIRALGVTRAPLEALGAFVYPQTFALPKANEAFAADGSFIDIAVHKKLADMMFKFNLFSMKLN